MERAKRDVILSVSKAPSKTTALIDLDVISMFPTCNIPSRDVIPYCFFLFVLTRWVLCYLMPWQHILFGEWKQEERINLRIWVDDLF